MATTSWLKNQVLPLMCYAHFFYKSGFSQCYGAQIPQDYAIWLIAFKNSTAPEILKDYAKRYLP